MGRPSKFGEPTQLIRVPLSKIEAVQKILDGDFVQNNGDLTEKNQNSSFFVQNQEGRAVEIPSYAIEPVLQLADALRFLHEQQNSKCCWAIRYDIDHLWNLLPIYHAESASLKLMAEIIATGEICQVVGYSVSLSKFGDRSTGVDLKMGNAVFHYGTHRVRIFIEGAQDHANRQAALSSQLGRDSHSDKE